ncbi:hypothetical protein AHAS_Ahas20G0138300 [Arachis hypogaea]
MLPWCPNPLQTPSRLLSPNPPIFPIAGRNGEDYRETTVRLSPLSSDSQSRLQASDGPVVAAVCVLLGLRRHHRHRLRAVSLVSGLCLSMDLVSS